MPHVIKVKANAEGRYPFTLYGQEYELEPTTEDVLATESKSQLRRKAAMTPKTRTGEDAQPTSEDNKPKNTGEDQAE